MVQCVYLLIIWELKKQQKQRNEIHTDRIVSNTDDNVKRVTVIVSRIVTVFLLCYLPFLAERQYYLIMLIMHMRICHGSVGMTAIRGHVVGLSGFYEIEF